MKAFTVRVTHDLLTSAGRRGLTNQQELRRRTTAGPTGPDDRFLRLNEKVLERPRTSDWRGQEKGGGGATSSHQGLLLQRREGRIVSRDKGHVGVQRWGFVSEDQDLNGGSPPGPTQACHLLEESGTTGFHKEIHVDFPEVSSSYSYHYLLLSQNLFFRRYFPLRRRSKGRDAHFSLAYWLIQMKLNWF